MNPWGFFVIMWVSGALFMAAIIVPLILFDLGRRWCRRLRR
jgi:hypothetical protein